MSTANESPSPGAVINTPDRDHAADSDDSLARKRQRLSEEPAEVRIEADEPEDMGDAMQNAIMIEDDAESDAYSSTFQVLPNGVHMTVLEELKKLQRMVNGDGMYRSLHPIRHVQLCRSRTLICADIRDLQCFANPTYWDAWLPGFTSISKTLPTIRTIGKPNISRMNDSSPSWQHSPIAYWTATIFSTLPHLRFC